MAQDISGFGLVVNVIASSTFPAGFVVTQFADDSDPFDIPSVQIADKAMGVNGDLVVWSRAVPIDVSISVIPGSPDDANLGILAQANRPGRGKAPALDSITLTGIYPDGTQITLQSGRLTNAPFGKSVASAGRMKSKTYTFTFQNSIG
ncbi:MAG: hypothetical protein BGO49_24455 [Planctomycetales bacterium 71-10]|nr:MAG: hypothetical protein BGO49_24455 [Planctomycetales bacterium 71-10]